jgi:hypothetical protein
MSLGGKGLSVFNYAAPNAGVSVCAVE